MPGLERQSPRLRGYDYSATGSYFVTVCARNGACWFGTIVDDRMLLTRLGRIVTKCWEEIPLHFREVQLDEFVVMPNHMHGIVCLTGAGHAPPLHLLIGSLKAAASRLAGRPLWQRSYFDRVIRNEAELQHLRQYVADNPLRWALDEENRSRN
jgi:putative transposase